MNTALASPSAVAGPASSMPIGRLLRAYLRETWYEFLQVLRSPAVAIPFLALPMPLYLLFGVMMAGSAEAMQENPELPNYLFSAFSVMAVMGPAIFSGCSVAIERDGGLLRLKRALPAPTGSYLMAKLGTSMVSAAIAIATIIAAGYFSGTLTLPASTVVAMATVMTAGVVPFSAVGLFLGTHVSGSAAPGIANLVYLPMLYLSGLFFPLPEALAPVVVIWPAFHLNQLSVNAAGLDEFTFVDPLMATAVLVGVTVLFGGLAIRRLAREGR